MLPGLGTYPPEIKRVRALTGSSEPEEVLRTSIVRAKTIRYAEGSGFFADDKLLCEAIHAPLVAKHTPPKLYQWVRETHRAKPFRGDIEVITAYASLPIIERHSLNLRVPLPSVLTAKEESVVPLPPHLITEISLYGVEIWRDMGLVCRSWYRLRGSYTELFLAQFRLTRSQMNPGDYGYPLRDTLPENEDPPVVECLSPSFQCGGMCFYPDIPLIRLPRVVMHYGNTVCVEFACGEEGSLTLNPVEDGFEVSPKGLFPFYQDLPTYVRDPLEDLAAFFYRRKVVASGPPRLLPDIIDIRDSVEAFTHIPDYIFEAAASLALADDPSGQIARRADDPLGQIARRADEPEEPSLAACYGAIPDDLKLVLPLTDLWYLKDLVLPQHLYLEFGLRPEVEIRAFEDDSWSEGGMPRVFQSVLRDLEDTSLESIRALTDQTVFLFYRHPETREWRFAGPRERT